uniref:Uncharacterized protein n=1 Tax=Acrobeloides nanus TaxID=290746 RepID=A0A914DBX8_9BILA
MSIMLCDLHQLKIHEVLPYYSKVWNILIDCLQNVINELNSNFSEDKMNKFSKLLKVAIYWWKKIWFHNELMPRLIMQIIKDEMISFKDNSHLITSEVMTTQNQYVGTRRYFCKTYYVAAT